MAFGASKDTVESLRAELHQAWSERSRFESLWHSEQEHTVRRGDEARSLRRELEATRAELAAAHAELAGLRGGVVRSGDCGGVVCVNTADVSGLGDGALLDRVVCLGEARNSIEGLYTEAVGEMVRRNCRQGAAWSLREYLRVSASQARSDAALAGDLLEHDLADTKAALRRGQITRRHARIIADSAAKRHQKDETELLLIARDYPADICARHTQAYESLETEAEARAVGEAARAAQEAANAELQAQREQRRAWLRRGEGGMWELFARLDSVTGRRVNRALRAAMESQRQKPDSGNNSQRAADALAALTLGETHSRRPAASLVIVADYDTLSGRLRDPRLDDGTPLSAEQLAQLAVDAKILPAIFDATWSNLALGKARNAGEAQKLVLALRDGGCIGCDAPSEQTHAHHIQHWSNGGPTNISNLASVCPPCHKLIHDHNWQIHIPPNGKPQLTAPHHLQHPKCTPTPTPTTTPAAAPRPPTPAHTNPILTT